MIAIKKPERCQSCQTSISAANAKDMDEIFALAMKQCVVCVHSLGAPIARSLGQELVDNWRPAA